MKTVLCFGDSNTRGYNPLNLGRLPYDDRYPGALQNILGDEYYVIEEGLDGRTTMLLREDEPFRNANYCIRPCICSHKPIDYMIVMLGTNDCLKAFNLNSKDIARGMDSLIQQIHTYSKLHQEYIPKIILACPAFIDANYYDSDAKDLLDDESPKKSKELVEYYKIIAKKYDCIFFNCNEYIKTMLPDAIHIDANSHKILAHEFAKIIKAN